MRIIYALLYVRSPILAHQSVQSLIRCVIWKSTTYQIVDYDNYNNDDNDDDNVDELQSYYDDNIHYNDNMLGWRQDRSSPKGGTSFCAWPYQCSGCRWHL